MNRCPDCGEAMYIGFCTWCHESVYIGDQYIGLKIEVPESIMRDIEKAEDETGQLWKGRCARCLS